MKNNIFDLTGQVALVAGGSSGLGLQFAKAMANAGANVAIVARRTDRLEKNAKEIAAEYGVEVYPHYLDLCDSKSVTKCVEDVIAHFGKIDILVNSGGTGGSGDPATMTDEQWAHVVDTDLTGLFYLCRDVARLSMIPNNYGRIVNVSSIHGFVSRKNVWTAPYCASKGGVHMMTKAMASTTSPSTASRRATSRPS
jgi:NAD(P)-dependent dehydrogenase (short-subunit alcohol dehydrogenase family)